MCLAPSSSGPGRRPLKAVARVQIPSGLRVKYQVKGLIAEGGGQALDHLSVRSAVPGRQRTPLEDGCRHDHESGSEVDVNMAVIAAPVSGRVLPILRWIPPGRASR